jgi:hypothetical protein
MLAGVSGRSRCPSLGTAIGYSCGMDIDDLRERTQGKARQEAERGRAGAHSVGECAFAARS